MPKGSNQKFKFTYLMKIMLDKTDDNYALTLSQIIDELNKYGVSAERKSIYSDFADMNDHFGIEIMKEQIGRETYYHVGSRDFELAEVKLLVDAIQSSRFITQNKSRELISKLKGLVSEHQAKQLQRQVFIDDRVKSMNESVLYNVDEIHTAINENKKIRFKYYKWDISKELVARNNNEWFTVSPWGLTWVNENYYMIAYDEWDGNVKNYRVDKMKHIEVIDEKRSGRKEFQDFDMASISTATFGMYGGKKQHVKLRFENSMCGVFLDRYGKDVTFRPVDEDHCEVWLDINVSRHFFGWLVGIGPKVKLVAPDEAVEGFKEYLNEILNELGDL